MAAYVMMSYDQLAMELEACIRMACAREGAGNFGRAEHWLRKALEVEQELRWREDEGEREIDLELNWGN